MLIFPEETRTIDGNLLPFQRGGFLIALKAGIPIVPVGLAGPAPVHAKAQLPRAAREPSRCGSGARSPTAGHGVTDKGELMAEVRRAVEELRGNTAAVIEVGSGGSGVAAGGAHDG